VIEPHLTSRYKPKSVKTRSPLKKAQVPDDDAEAPEQLGRYRLYSKKTKKMLDHVREAMLKLLYLQIKVNSKAPRYAEKDLKLQRVFK